MKAPRGFTLGLQLLLAASAATSIHAQTDGIPEVGIGAVRPICDPLQEECISSDEQVQDEIIAGLEAEDKVTAVPNVIELGELLCDSLDEASSSSVLRFAISSNETVTAERTSYSEFGGATFSDGNQRKTWKGEVVDPAPAADAAPTVVSMTWTSPCETETFLLKLTTRNPDGTISITTSVPCAAGSSTDICMVQYDLDLPPPTDPVDETTRDGTRRLARQEHQSTGKEHTGAPVRDSAPRSSRKLQSTVEVDVMFLYDVATLDRISVTAEQMETMIADELPASNEATANSQIDLQFNLVHTEQLPYTVGSTDDSSELFNFRSNPEVQALRDQYQADLVVLVGVFPSVCGRAYVNPNTVASDEDFGYGLIDVYCFDGRTTSHEIGHNMGAFHDRFNAGGSEYSYGKRYCQPDGERYITIMAYRCEFNTQDDESSLYAEQPNYFSNPDVEYRGLPTGTSTEDNARTLSENMVVVSNFRAGTGGLFCSPDVPGIPANDVCCPTSCGACGGTGCGQRDGGSSFSGSQACCEGGVRSLNRVCSNTVGAPCLITDDPPAPTPAPVAEGEMCAAGIPGILDGIACCPNSCGACGGVGCSGRDGGADFSGGEACCTGGVEGLGRTCSATIGAPCILTDDPPPPTPAPVTEEETCIADVPGILVSDVCCPNSCGSCGGVGCSGRDGGPDFTGGQACCGGGVRSLDRVCSSSVGAPCVVADDTPAPTPAPVTDDTCIVDVPGILVSDVCCPNSCGSCGGVGCSGRDGGPDFTGGQACCGGGVRSLDRVCSSSVGAPCVVAEDTPAPTPAPATDDTCIADVPGILVSDVCCPNSCGTCAGVGCSGRDGGPDFTGGQACCGGGVRSLGRVCSSSVGAPCVVAEDDDDSGDFTCDGIEKGDYCCSDGCGECGGVGCSNRGGGLTGEDCCHKNILDSGRVCSVTRAAPCFLD